MVTRTLRVYPEKHPQLTARYERFGTGKCFSIAFESSYILGFHTQIQSSKPLVEDNKRFHRIVSLIDLHLTALKLKSFTYRPNTWNSY